MVSAAVVIIAAVVVFFLFFNKGNSGSSQTVLTVNGESIPLEFSGFAYDDIEMGSYGYVAVFMGRKGTELYSVQALFLTDEDPTCPSANTSYDPLSSRYKDTVAVQFNYMDSSKGTEIYAASYDGGYDRAEIIVGDFKPNEKMEISISGKASDDGLTFDFSVSGNMEYFSNSVDLSNKLDSIVESINNSANNT